MGIEFLWKLIEDEADAISKYAAFLDSDFARSVEAEPIAATIRAIISDERDHLNALKYLHDAMTKEKAVTDMSDFARAALTEYRDRNKLIK